MSMTYDFRTSRNQRSVGFSKVFSIKVGRSNDDPQKHTDMRQHFLKLYKIAESYYEERLKHYQAQKAHAV